MCIAHYPNSEWLIQTTNGVSNYYEKLGFNIANEYEFLIKPSKYFK